MKNVRESQLKKCIFVEADDFTQIIKEILGDDVSVDYTLEGLDIHTDEDGIYQEELCAALQKYFDVKSVTSVHTDHFDYIGVWITYRD